MKYFDFCIGNPAFQNEADNNGRKPPVYHYFMDEAYKIADTVVMITPARFLFGAGQTPKAWNEKMLKDNHFKVLDYEPDAEKVFSNTEIKGGVAITIRKQEADYGKTGIFTKYQELNGILRKVGSANLSRSERFTAIVGSQGMYHFSEAVFQDYPEMKDAIGKGTGSKIISKMIGLLPNIFRDEKESHTDYIEILGRTDNERVVKYIPSSYIESNNYLKTYNVVLPKASGIGEFGEKLSPPFVIFPGRATTDTFVCIGCFEKKAEAEHVAKYLQTKFLRTLLGILKVTQDITPEKFKYVPLQDFTDKSDINWNKSIAEIDKQLYRKYGLSKEEIAFIETNVKEMQ